MEANALSLPMRFPSLPTSTSRRIQLLPSPPTFRSRSLRPPAVQKSKEQSTGRDEGLPPEFYDDEWQARQREKTQEWHAYRRKEEEEENRKTNEYREIGMRLKGYPEEEVREARKLVSSFIRAAEEVEEEWQARQREKTKEWHAYRQKEEEEENRKTNEYREIGMRLKGYPEEEVREARKLVSSFIRAAEEVEEKIEEAAEKDQLTELVLMVIWNRLDLARRDDEKDVIRSLDLLYRRVEAEILKRESTPSMRLLNDLLNLHDGSNDEGWLKKCRKCMIDTFPQEDPFSMLVPVGFDINNHEGRIGLPPEDDDVLLRVDFVREVDALLQEVRAELDNIHPSEGLDPESVANLLKQQEKQRTIDQVEALLELAISLKW